MSEENKEDNPHRVMIGLEIHAQLNKLNTKLFCGCSTKYHESEPNTHTCPICLGLPGSLPRINEQAVEFGIKIGLALGCSISSETQFHRKNYYYPDLPKGFQTSQYDNPIAENGFMLLDDKKIRITRAHIEEDPGRLIHIGSIEKSKGTLVDYNRSGMALIEIVTKPDMTSPKEARGFLDKMRNILEYLSVFDGSKEGAMKVDANISIMGGNRCEVKNISSHKGLEKAILYEITRQKNVLRRGGTVMLETRHFDEAKGVTISLRAKEESHDYRYFPEPDLVPMKISDRVSSVMNMIPELPDAKYARFISQYGIGSTHSKSLISDIKVANFYEECAKKIDPIICASWIADVLKGELNYRNKSIDSFKVKDMIEIISMVIENKITENSGVEVIRTILDNDGNKSIKTPLEIIYEKGLKKVETNTIDDIIQNVLIENKDAVKDYLNGKEQSLNFLVGQVMKKTRGRVDAKEVRELILKRISKL